MNKNILTLFSSFIITSLVFFSCSSDNEIEINNGIEINDMLLIGEWNLARYDLTMQQALGPTNLQGLLNQNDKEIRVGSLNFGNDSTGLSIENIDVYNESYEINGTIQADTILTYNNQLEFLWLVSSDTLKVQNLGFGGGILHQIVYHGESNILDYKIVELTENSLKLKLENSYKNVLDDGELYYFNVDLELDYIK